MPRRPKLRSGDVFRFRYDDTRFGVGQIILSKISLYIVIFEDLLSEAETDAFSAVSGAPLLAGWTHDAWIFHGRWTLVGEAQPLAPIHFPEFKVGFDGKTWVTDVQGNIKRPANRGEEQSLDFQWSRSPVAFVDAFEAHHQGKPRDRSHLRLFIK